MATLEQDGWTLDNAEHRNAEAPGTFRIPDRAERTGLQVGGMVQLLVLFLNEEPDGTPIIDCERLWVTVEGSTGGRYRGRLESLPHSSTVLAPLDRIEFGPEHVGAVFVREPDPRHPTFRIGG